MAYADPEQQRTYQRDEKRWQWADAPRPFWFPRQPISSGTTYTEGSFTVFLTYSEKFTEGF